MKSLRNNLKHQCRFYFCSFSWFSSLPVSPTVETTSISGSAVTAAVASDFIKMFHMKTEKNTWNTTWNHNSLSQGSQGLHLQILEVLQRPLSALQDHEVSSCITFISLNLQVLCGSNWIHLLTDFTSWGFHHFWCHQRTKRLQKFLRTNQTQDCHQETGTCREHKRRHVLTSRTKRNFFNPNPDVSFLNVIRLYWCLNKLTVGHVTTKVTCLYLQVKSLWV